MTRIYEQSFYLCYLVMSLCFSGLAAKLGWGGVRRAGREGEKEGGTIGFLRLLYLKKPKLFYFLYTECFYQHDKPFHLSKVKIWQPQSPFSFLRMAVFLACQSSVSFSITHILEHLLLRRPCARFSR